MQSNNRVDVYRNSPGPGQGESPVGSGIATAVRALAAIVALMAAPWLARAGHASSLGEALRETKPLIDMRLRYEEVEQAGIADTAHATTLRARLGLETGGFLQTSLLLEGSGLWRLNRSYRPDNAVPTYTQYPVVADPENLVVNRLSITNTWIPQTALTIGRQRINLDDQRFVGNTGWRQNEVTYDAVRLVNKSVAHLTLDLIFLDKVHRQFGVDSPQGTYKGDSYLANISFQSGVGKLTAFAYLLEFDPIIGLVGALDPRRGSTSTFGGRIVGEFPVTGVRVGYLATYASQTPRGDNPLIFTNDYLLGEVSVAMQGFRLAAGDEVMRGNGIVGFTTPLATLHMFEGWADKFLTTPPNGIKDPYGSLSWRGNHLLRLDWVNATLVYRKFDAQRISADYGAEWDYALSAKWHHCTALLQYADYRAAPATVIARDTRKFWAQLEYVW